MPKANNFIGMKFGKLTVVSRDGSSSGNSTWRCMCDCGREKTVTSCNLKSKGTVSCGCHRDAKVSSINRTHGRTKSPEYRSWQRMHSRCYNSKDKSYLDYGNRGIKVCERWQSFEGFLADMGQRPSEKHSIDRINNDGDYEPSNCRWATRTQQNNNKRDNHRIQFRGKTLTMAEWARLLGIDRSVIKQRLKRGWPVEKSLTTPVRK